MKIMWSTIYPQKLSSYCNPLISRLRFILPSEVNSNWFYCWKLRVTMWHPIYYDRHHGWQSAANPGNFSWRGREGGGRVQGSGFLEKIWVTTATPWPPLVLRLLTMNLVVRWEHLWSQWLVGSKCLTKQFNGLHGGIQPFYGAYA